MLGTLHVDISDTPIAREHQRLLETALRRGDGQVEAKIRRGLERDYAPDVLSIARRMWLERMRHEHRSATVFSQLLPQLIAAEAPLDMKTCVLRMAMDELRHAGLCGAVAEQLGAEPRIEAELQMRPLPVHEGCSAAVSALRNVLFICCVSETVAISILSHELELVTEPCVRAAVAQLAADETLHGRFGWIYLTDAWPSLSDGERAQLGDYLPTAFSHFDRDVLGGDLTSEAGRRRVDDDLWALGVRDGASTRELALETIETIIVEQLEAIGLPARRAWAARR